MKSKGDIRRQEELGEKLKESEIFYRAIFENTGTAIVIIEEDTKISAANNEFCKLSGYSRQELEGKKSWTDFVVKEDLPRMLEYHKARRGDPTAAPRNYEFRFIRKGGDIRQIFLTVAMIPQSAKSITSLIDITCLKQKEEEIRRFQTMVEAAHDAIFFKDLKSRYLKANQPTLAAFGLPKEKVIGKSDLEIMADRNEAGNNIRDDQLVFKTGKASEIVKRMTGADGKEYWFQAVKVPQFDDDGKITGLVGIARDVTNMKSAEEALRESEEKYRSFVRAVADAFILLDPKGSVQMANDAAAVFFRKPESRIVGKNLSKLLPGKTAISLIAAVKKVMKTKMTAVDVFWHNQRYFEALLTPIKTEKGKVGGITIVARDITDWKQAEDESKRALGKLKEFKDIINRSPALVFVWRVLPGKWPVEYVSDNVKEILGYSPDDFISGRVSWPGITHAEDVPRLEEEVARYLKAGKSEWSQEYRLITSEGKVRWFRDQNLALPDARGRISQIQSIVIDITEQRRAWQRISKLNKCFLSLGADIRKNIEIIVNTAGEILGGACLLYNRLEKERGLLCTWAIWQKPQGYNPEDHPEGHICYDVITKGKGGPVIIEDLTGTKYEKTDPNVKKYGLKSYLGHPVKLKGKVVGSFCLCDVKRRKFSEDEINVIGMLAGAVAIEEERRYSQAALLEAREKLKEITESARDVIFQLNSEGLINYISPNVKELYGYQAEDLIGQHLTATTPLPEVPRALKALKAVLEGKIIKGFEITQLDQRKSIIPVEINLTPVKRKGRVIAAQGILRDISRRKRAEAERARALHELNERVKELNCLFELAKIVEIPHITLDKIFSKVVKILPAAWQHPEITCARIKFRGREFKTANFKETRWRLKSDIKIQGKKAGRAEIGYLKKKSSPAGESPFIKEEEDLLAAIAGRLGRIAEWKQAETAIKDSEERFRTLFEISPVGIFVLDPEGKILAVNEAVSGIYGYTCRELLNLNVENIFPKGIAGNFPRLIKKMRRDKTLHFESVGKRKDGRSFPVALSINIFHQEKDEFLQVLCQDLSEREAAEETRRLKKISEMMMTFQEEERKHIARELHDHIGQNLAALKISLDMMKSRIPDSEKSILRELEEIVVLSEKIIADVRRTYSTLRPASLEELGLTRCLKHEIAYLSSRSGLKIEFDGSGFKERLDPEKEIQIYRIIQEALTNIIKHAKAKKVQVTLSRKAGNILLAVRDDGHGFKPGAEKIEGGLGLLGIRERVDAAGGSIQIKSRPGRGTKISIKMPL
jgi:PAS domain S-box-containing protein